MRTTRPIILLVILVIGLGSIVLLPKVVNSTPSGVTLSLPTFVGDWYGRDQAISPQELQVLAKDTEFARKLYTNAEGDEIFASIVLSGHDLDNSIHRPERCLPAQGWTIADTRVIHIPVKEAAHGDLAVTRLHDIREVPTKDGKKASIYNLNYYWFVGSNTVTPSHLEREYLDMRDRILHGYNQRWAYITVASNISAGLTHFGKNEQQTDAMLRDFTAKIFPQISALSP
jgi:EpsI family protein